MVEAGLIVAYALFAVGGLLIIAAGIRVLYVFSKKRKSRVKKAKPRELRPLNGQVKTISGSVEYLPSSRVDEQLPNGSVAARSITNLSTSARRKAVPLSNAPLVIRTRSDVRPQVRPERYMVARPVKLVPRKSRRHGGSEPALNQTGRSDEVSLWLNGRRPQRHPSTSSAATAPIFPRSVSRQSAGAASRVSARTDGSIDARDYDFNYDGSALQLSFDPRMRTPSTASLAGAEIDVPVGHYVSNSSRGGGQSLNQFEARGYNTFNAANHGVSRSHSKASRYERHNEESYVIHAELT